LNQKHYVDAIKSETEQLWNYVMHFERYCSLQISLEYADMENNLLFL